MFHKKYKFIQDAATELVVILIPTKRRRNVQHKKRKKILSIERESSCNSAKGEENWKRVKTKINQPTR